MVITVAFHHTNPGVQFLFKLLCFSLYESFECVLDLTRFDSKNMMRMMRGKIRDLGYFKGVYKSRAVK